MKKIIEWREQGQIDWELWWVLRHGYTRTETPNLENHISFANFELKHYNSMIIKENKMLIIEYHQAQEGKIKIILKKHGFYIKDNE